MSCGTPRNQGNRHVRAHTMCEQLATDDWQADKPHVEHQGLPFMNKLLPRQIAAVVLQVPGDKPDRLGEIPMRERDTGIGGTSIRRRYAGHHLKRDACVGEPVDFLTATAKNERIAAL